MDLDLSDDQVALRDGIASLLDGRFGMERVRGGFDRAMFDELTEAGVFSLRADGFSWADCVVVFEQLGRHCVPGPLTACLLSDLRGIVGVVEQPDAMPAWVEHLDVLDVLLVLDGDRLWHADPRALDARPSTWPLDPLTPVAAVDSFASCVRVVADVAEFRRAGAVLTAALQLGLADRLTEMAVAYAKERVQFDRPIGSFQAIKHMLADMLTRTEVARAAVYSAGAVLDERPSAAMTHRLAYGAKVVAGDAAIANGKAATQVFGGMGFTWEVDVHLYLKRAWVLDSHFGSADMHADVVARALSAAI